MSSKKAERLRERAEKHRTLARLYDRSAAKQELADSLKEYGARLDDNARELEELDKSTKALEAELRKEPATDATEEAASVRNRE